MVTINTNESTLTASLYLHFRGDSLVFSIFSVALRGKSLEDAQWW